MNGAPNLVIPRMVHAMDLMMLYAPEDYFGAAELFYETYIVDAPDGYVHFPDEKHVMEWSRLLLTSANTPAELFEWLYLVAPLDPALTIFQRRCERVEAPAGAPVYDKPSASWDYGDRLYWYEQIGVVNLIHGTHLVHDIVNECVTRRAQCPLTHS